MAGATAAPDPAALPAETRSASPGPAQYVFTFRVAFRVEHTEQRLVGVGHVAPRASSDSTPVGEYLEDNFHLAAALIEFSVGRIRIAARGLDLLQADFSSSAMRLKERTKSPISSAAVTSIR